MKSLAKELDLEDFNVIVTGNRARTADNFYFVNLYDDVLSKSAGNVFNDVSFMPPRIQSQYFSLYSDKNASVSLICLALTCFSEVHSVASFFAMK